MILAVTAKGKTLDDHVDPRFGRCPCFLVINTETMEADAVENPNTALGGGAGIQSGQLMADRDVSVVLTGNCGPNAYQTLEAAGIQVIVGVSGTVRDVVEQYKSGSLSSAQAANVGSHFGMGGGAPPSPQAAPQASTPQAQPGMGTGRGMGMGRGRGVWRATPSASPQGTEAQDGGSELEALKAEAEKLESQLQAVKKQIAQAEHDGRPHLIAVVDADQCTACGICERVCPTDAITVNHVATIAPARCNGCGQCVAECPQGALMLKRAS